MKKKKIKCRGNCVNLEEEIPQKRSIKNGNETLNSKWFIGIWWKSQKRHRFGFGIQGNY